MLGAGLEAAKADATNTSYDGAIARLQNAGLGVVINKTTAWAGKKVANGALDHLEGSTQSTRSIPFSDKVRTTVNRVIEAVSVHIPRIIL